MTPTARFLLPRPDPDPAVRLTTHIKDQFGQWRVVELALLAIVPNRVYAVAKDFRDTGVQTQAGEFLVAVLDEDHDFQWPSRYMEGSYAALRAAKEMELNLPGYNPRLAEQWLNGNLPVHDDRGRRVREWQTAYIGLNTAVMGYVKEVRAWAENAARTNDVSGGGRHVDQLRVLTYRPFSDWLQRMIRSIACGHPQNVMTECDLLTQRVALEAAMSVLSHSLHHVERFEKNPGRRSQALQSLVSPEKREELAAQVMNAREHIALLTEDRGIRPKRTLNELEGVTQAIAGGQLRAAKEQLDQAFVSFALMF